MTLDPTTHTAVSFATQLTPLGPLPDLAAAETHARIMLNALGITCADEATAKTPHRLVKALAEMTRGLRTDPTEHLSVTFPGEGAGLVSVQVPFNSLCEHHLLPVTGRATVAYLPRPGARIVGLSKLARLLHGYAERPQVQERLGQQVVDALMSHLDSAGAACLIRARHACLTHRGVRAGEAAMYTQALAGALATDPQARGEVLRQTPDSP